MYHSLKPLKDFNVSLEDFKSYYSIVSTIVKDEKYFEYILRSSWRFPAQMNTSNNTYEHKNGLFSNTQKNVIAPYGVSQDPVNYRTYNRPYLENPPSERSTGRNRIAAGYPSWPMREPSEDFDEDLAYQQAFEKLRSKLLSRGPSGILGLTKMYWIIDVEGSGLINMYEFGKGIKENRIIMDEFELRLIFSTFDLEGNGAINYFDLMNEVTGRMNEQRSNAVVDAFASMCKSGDDLVPFNY